MCGWLDEKPPSLGLIMVSDFIIFLPVSTVGEERDFYKTCPHIDHAQNAQEESSKVKRGGTSL